MGRTAIYARISRDAEATQAGVARQTADCHGLCAQRGFDDVAEYVDNHHSAYIRNRPRPEYARMVDDIKNGDVDRVVVWHSDRLHRSPRELEDFIDIVELAGVDVVTVTAGDHDLSTPDGRFKARIECSVARKESEDRSRRITRKHEELAAAGRPHGGGRRPYGYRVVLNAAGKIDRYEVDAAEAVVIADAMRQFLAGTPIYSILADLVRRDVPTAAGGAWSHSTLRQLLRSPRISGQREHRGVIVGDATWPAIVTKEQTAKARAILDDPTRRRRVPHKYLLTGIASCGLCGHALVGGPRYGRGEPIDAYTCPKDPLRPGCGRISIKAATVDELVAEAAIQAIDTPRLANKTNERDEPRVADVVLEDLNQARDQLDELAGLYGTKVISLAEWLAARKPIEQRIDKATRELASTRADATVSTFLGRPGLLRKEWDGYDVARRNAILAAIVDKVEIGPVVRRGSTAAQFDRITVRWRA